MSRIQDLLKLNNYLPIELQTENIDKLIDIIDVILSTSFVIERLNITPSKEETIPLLYNDIYEEILSKQHPYYYVGYCQSNNEVRRGCEHNKYTLLKKWCFPHISRDEIRVMLPNINYSDVVKLSLVYNPISESTKYYDWLTIFYHSCLAGQSHPEIFYRENQDTFTSVLMICYKFNRVDVLNSLANSLAEEIKDEYPEVDDYMSLSPEERMDVKVDEHMRTADKLINYETIHFVIDLIKLRTTGSNLQTYTQDVETHLTINDMSFVSNLFEPEELFELFIMMSLRLVMYSGIIDRMDIGFGATFVAVLGRDKVISIASKYYPNFVLDERNYKADSKILRDTCLSKYLPVSSEATTSQLLFSSGLEKRVFPNNVLGNYYITSGKFTEYVNWSKDNKLEKSNIADVNNVYGFLSNNLELSLITRNSLDYPLFSKWKVYDVHLKPVNI
jgi:hypothetical protein